MIPLILLLMAVASVDAEPVRVGSKSFTESVILGEIVARLARDTGVQSEHQREFGGTRRCRPALRGFAGATL